MVNKIWHPDNKDAFYPRLRSYVAQSKNSELNVVSDRYLVNIAYLRVKNITIGYTLPHKLIPQLRKVRIFVSGQNLLTFTPLTGYVDPVNASNAINLSEASSTYDYSSTTARLFRYPESKKFTIGINIRF
jgi:hypothetical protein